MVTKLQISLASLAVATLIGIAAASSSAAKPDESLTLDIACDARTFAMNPADPANPFARGSTFVVSGKLYAPLTIPAGGTSAAPGPFDLDDEAAHPSIGKWICRGTLTLDDTAAGVVTQFYLLKNGDGLITEGITPQVSIERAIVGGLGQLSGAAGREVETIIGFNKTGFENFTCTYGIKKQALK
jgi:hypothetical protein